MGSLAPGGILIPSIEDEASMNGVIEGGNGASEVEEQPSIPPEMYEKAAGMSSASDTPVAKRPEGTIDLGKAPLSYHLSRMRRQRLALQEVEMMLRMPRNAPSIPSTTCRNAAGMSANSFFLVAKPSKWTIDVESRARYRSV